MKNSKPFGKGKFALSLISTTLLSTMAGTSLAADEVQAKDVERIHVTGSSIKRTDLEGSLPVTTISQEEIMASGVTSVPDLIQQMPAMQGFTSAAQSVGSTSGYQTASLRDLGSSYTLVLLNGRRMAPRDSGSSVDISSIPLAAIERVEILMDGASALYGSDAIAGVVNFIMKRDYQGNNVEVRLDKTQHGGADSADFSITTGFGDYDNDGFNLMLSYTHNEQSQLKSSQREFGQTGIVPFSYQGEDLYVLRASPNAIPANAYVSVDKTSDYYLGLPEGSSSTISFNPYREQNNGVCAEKSIAEKTTCLYDYTETVEIYPENERDTLFLQGLLQLTDDAELYTTAALSRHSITARIAPKTVSKLTLDADNPLIAEHLHPHMTAEQIDAATKYQIRWRARPAGNRTSEYETVSKNLTAGIRGAEGELNYDVAFTYSDSSRDNNRIAGYVLDEEFRELMNSGTINVFTTPDQLTDEQNAAVYATNFNGNWWTRDTNATSIEGTASMPVFELPAGEVYLGAGFDYRQVSYAQSTSQANKDQVLFSYKADPESDLSRDTYGVFLEAIAPITEELEVTAAVRYDNIGAITDSKRAAGEQTVNVDVDDTTYKLSLAYRPNDDLLIRASIGTGFKAATMAEIAEPKVEAGWTSGSYDCPLTSSDPLFQYCHEDRVQYHMAREGYDKLAPETSKQASVGFVYAPSHDFSFSVDWWQINMENQVRRLTEQQIFGDPVKYRDLFGTKLDLGSGDQVIEVNRAAVNVGKSNNSGIDWAFSVGNDLGFGELKTTIRGAYMIESESLRVGTEDIYDSSLGKFGTNNAVTFRNVIKMGNTLKHGDFAHTVNVNYKSGYQDMYHKAGSSKIRYQDDIESYYDGGVHRNVSSYVTVNYVSKWYATDDLKVSFGIKNLFDKQPPLSLRTAGGGHQVGYDPRYVDQLGRTFYLKADYSF